MAASLALTCAVGAGSVYGAQAQGGAGDTLRVLSTQHQAVLDVASPSRTLAGYGLSVMIYDRLLTFELAPTFDGFQESDMSKPKGELAESWTISPDRKTITFVLRDDATFHNGAPVTAEDVKWSFERAMALPASKAILRSGGIEEPEQFKVIDERTIEFTLEEPNRLALLSFGSPVTPIIDSKAAKEHATSEDPWAVKWLEQNSAGSGAYTIESFKPSEQVVYRRFEDWKGGEAPHFERIVYQTVPEASNIIALLERGSADLSADIPLKDIPAIQARGTLKTGSLPLRNSMEFVALNTQSGVLQDKRVRQAIAYALPYESIFGSIFMNAGEMLNCATSNEVEPGVYPRAYPYCTDYEKAKELLADAGYPDGLSLTFTFDTSRAPLFEPLSVLIKDSLQQAGIEINIQKMVGAQFAQALEQDSVDFYAHTVNAWLGSITDYWFRTFFRGKWRNNYGSYHNDQLNEILETLDTTHDDELYNDYIEQMIGMIIEDVPLIPLRLRTIDVVQAKDISGYTAWFHGNLDLRQVKRD